MSFWRKSKKTVTTEAMTDQAAPASSAIEMLERHDLSRESFFLLYSRLIEERLDGRDLHFIEDGGLTFTTPGGKTRTTYLENVWRECREGVEPRTVIVERYLASLGSLEDEGETTRDQIVAIIKDSEYVSLLGKDTKVALEHMAGDVWIVYALDLPKSTRSLSLDEMVKLNVTREELRPLALENLKRILPDIKCHGAGPWFLLTAGGDYVASILLLDGVWEQLAATVEGDLVAVVPSRDVLLFTGGESTEGLAAIREKADEIHSGGHHVVSRTLLRRVEGRWVNFN
jgi:hypothetical protein